MPHSTPEKRNAYQRSRYATCPKVRAAVSAANNSFQKRRRAAFPEVAAEEARAARVRRSAEKGTPEAWLKHVLAGSRYRAKRAGIAHDITGSDVAVPAACPITGLTLNYAGGKCGPTTPSLDRVVPSKGYVKGNVRVISYRANARKGDATIDEMRAILHYMERELEGVTP